tara:strand:+ start:3355 stop:3798 length:444 start_codon:yes stop_codon:yes gene_type:complete
VSEMNPFETVWKLLKREPISSQEKYLLEDLRLKRPTRITPTQLSAETPADKNVKPRPLSKIPAVDRTMTVNDANEFNSQMADRPEAQLNLQSHMAEIEARKRAEEEADAAYEQPHGTDGHNPNRVQAGEPMDIAWQLLKEEMQSISS